MLILIKFGKTHEQSKNRKRSLVAGQFFSTGSEKKNHLHRKYCEERVNESN